MSGPIESGGAPEFTTAYESREGLSVLLEVAHRTDSAGRPYLHHRLTTADGRPGAVVLAVRDDSILLVRSERASIERELWELPRGSGELADRQNPALQTAIRELREETGYLATGAELLGTYVIDSSIYPQRVNAVLCRVESQHPQFPNDGEILESRWVPSAEILQLIANGIVVDAHSLAGLALWLARSP